MPVITTREELKRYLMDGVNEIPTDRVLDSLFRLIKDEGANPYHLKIAYIAGLHIATLTNMPRKPE